MGKTYIAGLLVALLALMQSAVAEKDMNEIMSRMDAADAAGKSGTASSQDTGESPEDAAAVEAKMLASLFEEGIARYKAGWTTRPCRKGSACLYPQALPDL